MTFDEGLGLKRQSHILSGTGIFLVLFYIYPIVPYASAFCAHFLILQDLRKSASTAVYCRYSQHRKRHRQYAVRNLPQENCAAAFEIEIFYWI